MTKTLSLEWSRYNIKLNAVAPGIIKSSGTVQYGEEVLEQSLHTVPLMRFGTTEECAYLITYLPSEKIASYITGQTYYIGKEKFL